MPGYETILPLALAALAAPDAAQNPTSAEAEKDIKAADRSSAIAAEIAAIRARLEALESELATLRATPAKAPAEPPLGEQTTWKGAPEIESDAGWSFKPRGRLQLDAGWVSEPEGIDDPGLGLATELRAARLGVEGDMPGGFGYKLELDFADGDISVADALISYRANEHLEAVIGHHKPFQSLEEVTSSRFTSFIERAAFTDAFGFERRVGISAEYKRGNMLLSGGLFTDDVESLADDANRAIGLDGRIVYAPLIGAARFHFGGSAHYRDNDSNSRASIAARYRQRPLIHATDVRFVSTLPLAIAGESHYGLEFAAVGTPWHIAAEAHWLTPDLSGGDPDPSFFGGYVEAGIFLTGERRSYDDGAFGRTRLGDDSQRWGAVQLNLRYDRLDLGGGAALGGVQNGYLASLIWIPHDHVRFLLNYGHILYSDAAIPATGGERDYAVDVIGARAQIDF